MSSQQGGLAEIARGVPRCACSVEKSRGAILLAAQIAPQIGVRGTFE